MNLFGTKTVFHAHPDARVFTLSERVIHDRVWHCALYEWEDLIGEWESVDTYLPAHSFKLSRRLYTLANYATDSKLLSRLLTPHFDTCYLNQKYDLFFIICMDIFELIAITSINNWREKCRNAVCYLNECWSEEWLKGREFLLRPLREFDHIFLGTRNSVEIVSKITGRPCTYLPVGIDAVKFAPIPELERSIDVWNIGRRSSVTHQALLKLAEQKQWLYYFDTVKNGNVLDSKEHRLLVSNLLKRCSYFIANHARADEADITRGHMELGTRYFEGAAAGTVMLGKPPAPEVLNEHFNWPDAVIPIPFDAPGIADTIADLEVQPMRLARIRRDNVVNSLLRHDWVYRWRRVLEAVGLEVTPQMVLRESLLRDMAAKLNAPG
ncbi:MAG: glycosyltransferase family 1 protein [Burkholderiales bacterium]|nr:glycosyltransferase family 1 protein [Burkholderiales bacterium]